MEREAKRRKKRVRRSVERVAKSMTRQFNYRQRITLLFHSIEGACTTGCR